MTMGEKIRHKRDCKELSQKELARLAGITPQTLCNIENGKCTDIRITTFTSLCKALGVNANEMFDD